jgi:two-component system, chemotaxis family, CheB/CheR fusion protein
MPKIKKIKAHPIKRKEHLSTIVDSVRLPLAVLDSKFRILFMNQTFHKIFHTHPSTVGQNLLTLLGFDLHKEKVQQLGAELRKAISSRDRAIEFEIREDLPPLGRKTLSFCAKAIKWVGSGPSLLVSVEDVTHRRWLEGERNRLLNSEKEARSEAEKTNRAKDVFLATLSHELRTPLNSLLMWSQLLQKRELDSKETAKGLEIIERSARNLERLIRDLLDISRIVIGKISLEKKATDPRKILQNSIDALETMMRDKAITIDAHINPRLRSVYADPVRLQQIFSNLLTNAIKFSPNRGRIMVRLEQISGARGRELLFEVADNGKGIQKDFLPHVFEHFTQEKEQDPSGGMGLGLAIVRDLVELHGGTVLADSQGEGKGSVFTITLPLLEPKRGRIRNPRAGELQRLDGVELLLVDDDPNELEGLATVLRNFGAVVETARSSREAMGRMKKKQFDLLVSDISMPEEDGFTFIRKVRKLPRTSGGQTPSIALTAFVAPYYKNKAMAAGYQSFVAKPINTKELVKVASQLATA